MKGEYSLVPEPHIQSRAALVLLQRQLGTFSPPDWQVWLSFRVECLLEMEKNGPLHCVYCTTGPLHIDHTGIHKAYRATIDHVIPLRMTKAPYDKGNIVVACMRCNSSKGDRLLHEWRARPINYALELLRHAETAQEKKARRRRKERKRKRRADALAQAFATMEVPHENSWSNDYSASTHDT